jgi:hypothetical protein
MAQAGEKVLPVLVVIYDPALFNPPEDNVVEGSWSIESRLAGQMRVRSFILTFPLSCGYAPSIPK